MECSTSPLQIREEILTYLIKMSIPIRQEPREQSLSLLNFGLHSAVSTNKYEIAFLLPCLVIHGRKDRLQEHRVGGIIGGTGGQATHTFHAVKGTFVVISPLCELLLL